MSGRGKSSWLVSLVIYCLGTLAFIVYALLGYLRIVLISETIFFSFVLLMMAIIASGNVIFWRQRKNFSLKFQLVVMLMSLLHLWYWLAAPIFHFTNINANVDQLYWTFFIYAYSVPVVGGVLIVPLNLFVFQPIHKYLSGKKVESKKLLASVRSFPLRSAIIMFLCSIIGYSNGSLQLALLESWPLIEQIKNVMLGMAISILLCILYYLFIDLMLSGVRKKLEEDSKMNFVPDRYIRNRFAFITAFIGVAAITLLIINTVQSVQLQVEEQLRSQFDYDFKTIEEIFGQEEKQSQSYLAEGVLRKSDRDDFIVGGYPLADSAEERLATALSENKSGYFTILTDEIRMVAYFVDPTHNVYFANTVYLQDFYSFLRTGFIFKFATSGVFIFVTIIAVSLFSAQVVSDALRKLTNLVLNADESLSAVTSLHTGDEIQVLASEFQKYIKYNKELQSGLEKKVEERTQQLERENAQDEALLISIGEGVIATDSAGEVTFVNQAAEKLLRCSAEDLVGRIWGVGVAGLFSESGEPVPTANSPLVRSLQTGEKISATYLINRKDYTTMPVQLTASPVNLDGETIGAIVVFRDVTHEREVNRAKTEFVSLASHQLRTPLSTINWYVETLLSGKVSKVTEKEKEYLSAVHRASQRLAGLVGALLNVSRIELGTFAVDPKPEDLSQLVEEAVEEIEPQTKKKSIKVGIDLAKDLPKIQVDRKLFLIVINNLLSNAMKYTPEEGKIFVKLEASKNEANEDVAQLSVKDTGVGIPKEQHSQVFRKLFRADNVQKLDTEGTGLGLYVVKSIINITGSDIGFTSEKGKGTTFTITIPFSGMLARSGQKTLEGSS